MFEGDLLKERARLTPDKLALVCVETGRRLSYRELNALAEQAAAAVIESGVEPGERFGILAHNSIEFVSLFFAAGKAGAIVVPLSTRATAHELRAIVEDCGMKALFHDDELAAVANECHPERLEGPGPVGALRSILLPPPTQVPRDARDDKHGPESTYALLYTSGTTGQPKGVMIPRRQLLWNGYNTVMSWGLREDDISPVFTPMYHAGGLAAFLIPIFCAGGTIVLQKAFDASEVWKTIEREGCTVVLGVPTIWKLLMDAPEFQTASLERVRWFISGGAPLPAYISEAYEKRGVVLKQGYGMTEVGVNCFAMSAEESRTKRGSIGRPMLFTEVELRDGAGAAVPVGEVGEMYIRGPHVSSGYWNNPAETALSYLKDGWFRTGDLARRDDDGFFYIAGRCKEMFISGGVNVYPAEIEAELVLHPSVSDAAVVAMPHETWGEAGVAFVVARGVTAADLTEYLALRIAKYKVPRRFIFLEALPRTPYGKVEKARLRASLT